MTEERVKNTASVESMENLVKSCQKEILAMKVFQSDMGDLVANNMAFLGGAIQLTKRISEPQVRDAVINKLGVPRDDASMYARQISAALSNVISRFRKATDGSKLHPAVQQIGSIGRLEPGSGNKKQTRTPSRSPRSRSPARAASTSASASASAMSPGTIYRAYGVKPPTGIPLGPGKKSCSDRSATPSASARRHEPPVLPPTPRS